MKYAMSLAVSMSLAAAGQVCASALIVSNTGEASAGSAPVDVVDWYAQAFQPNSDFTLDQIDATIQPNTEIQSTDVFARLYIAGNDGSVSGTPIDSFIIPDFASETTANLRSFVSTSQARLQGGATYFFVLGVTADYRHLDWDYTDSLNGAGLGEIPATNTCPFSSDQGQTWIPNAGDGYPQMIAVYGTPVPEPVAAGMLIGAAAGWLGRRRRSH